MGPRREEQVKPEPRGEPKPKRFRLIRLEERIAPAAGANGSHNGGGGGGCVSNRFCTGIDGCTWDCTASCSIE
jgi:hypothetical protein